jgi:hypothetical protein
VIRANDIEILGCKEGSSESHFFKVYSPHTTRFPTIAIQQSQPTLINLTSHSVVVLIAHMAEELPDETIEKEMALCNITWPALFAASQNQPGAYQPAGPQLVAYQLRMLFPVIVV